MKNKYTFASDKEPTETQLKNLMHEVAVEAKQKAVATNTKLMAEITQAILAAMQKVLEANKQ